MNSLGMSTVEEHRVAAAPRRAFWTNVAFLIGQNVLAPMFSVLLVVALSRLRGAEAMGRYALAMAFFGFGEALATLGLGALITRQVATRPLDAGRWLVNTSAVAFTVLALGVVGVLPAVWFGMADHELRLSMILVVAALPPSVLISYGQAALLGLDHSKDLVLIDLCEALGRSVMATAVILAGASVIGVVVVMVVFRFFAAAAYAWRLWALGVRIPSAVELSACQALAKQALVFGAIPVVNALYSRLDLFLLGRLRGLTDAGYYNAAGRFQDAVRPFPRGFVRALYSTLSRADHQSPELLLEEARRAFVFVLSSLLPLAIALSVLAEPLIIGVYGQQFRGSVPAATLFGWVIVPYGLTVLLAHVLFATGNQRYDLRVNVAALGLSAVLNALMVPLWGAAGAAGALLLVTTASAALEYRYVRKTVGDLRLGSAIARLGLSATCAYGAVMALRHQSLAIGLGAGLVTYLIEMKLTDVLGARRAPAFREQNPLLPPERLATGAK